MPDANRRPSTPRARFTISPNARANIWVVLILAASATAGIVSYSAWISAEPTGTSASPTWPGPAADGTSDGGASIRLEAARYDLETYRHNARLAAVADDPPARVGPPEPMSRAQAIERLSKVANRELGGLERAAGDLEAGGDRIEAAKCKRAADRLRRAVEVALPKSNTGEKP